VTVILWHLICAEKYFGASMSFLNIIKILNGSQSEGSSGNKESEPGKKANYAALFAALGAVYSNAFLPDSILSQASTSQSEELNSSDEE
jgi:hypothetical protein